MALPCRWRSRPQHQKRTYAAPQKVPLFDHLVGAQLEFTADRKPKRLRSLEIDERGQLCPIAIAGIVAASSALMNICYGGRVMAMKIDRIQPAGMNVRIQQGKPAYSHVVTVTGPGKTIYIAGQLARDAKGNIVGPGDMRAQLEQTFKNLDACLKAAGATWADVVKTNTFVTDYQAFSQCSDVRMRYFGVASPTSTTIQIGGLAQPEAMVEIEMIAVVE
jgi:2-iminobutanoate/2-iminopropanoate deaminase